MVESLGLLKAVTLVCLKDVWFVSMMALMMALMMAAMMAAMMVVT